MRRNLFRFVMSCLLLVTSTAAAQSLDLTIYAWEAADLALSYPADWEPPLPSQTETQLTLRMAQSQTANDSRPPEIPMITLTLLLDASTIDELAPLVTAELIRLGIGGVTPQSAPLLGYEGVISTGTSADGALFGIAQAVFWPDDRVLIASGRAPNATRDNFRRLYDAVLNSIVFGTEMIPLQPAYGVLWHTSSTAEDAENAFLQPIGLALSADNTLYTADLVSGVIQLDAVTGRVRNIFPYEQPGLPSDIAVSGDGRVYVADTACGCILVLNPDGTWGANIGSGLFGADAPRSIAAAPDGTLYATDEDPTNAYVRIFRPNGETEVVNAGEAFFLQPLLTINTAGQLLALSVDNLLFRLDRDQFVLTADFAAAPSFISDIASLRNNLVLTTLGGEVLIFNSEGQEINRIGRVVANFPLPGEFVSPTGVAVSADGTVYIADGDGVFGAITAMSTAVEVGRVGSSVLIPDVAVQGSLSASIPQQTWTFEGATGQEVMITAIDNSGIGELDLAIRLFNPAGGEEAYNDDHGGLDLLNVYDAQIPHHVLQMSGTYIVIVELINGEGTYTIGIRQPQSFQFSAEGTAYAEGTLSEVFPVQRWQFEGRAGQVITITMMVTDDSALDPQIRLFTPDGVLIDENDDAADPALGLNAQLVQVTLPVDGLYRLEATRFQGSGAYALTVVTTSP